jgi:hypothetical protein
MTDPHDDPPAERRAHGTRISATTETDIRRMIMAGDSDLTIAKACGVSQPSVAIRRARLSSPPDLSVATPLVIGALRHLASSDGLSLADVASRLGMADATLLVHTLITLGVVRRTVGEPPRYGLRKDWL